jgi:hypothetical protein
MNHRFWPHFKRKLATTHPALNRKHRHTESPRRFSCIILPDFGDLGARLADDAADELVGDGHLVGLVGAGRPTLSGEQRQC